MTIHNPAMLRFLAAVQQHADTGRALMRCSGYDPLEMQVALAAAREAGLIEPTAGAGRFRLSDDGRAWARAQMAPFAPLLRVCAHPARTSEAAA